MNSIDETIVQSNCDFIDRNVDVIIVAMIQNNSLDKFRMNL